MAKETIPYSGPIVTRAQASAAGLKRYFTGATCPRGHLAERTVNGRGCLRCISENAITKRASDPERSREYQAVWQSANKDKTAQYCKVWREKNPEKARDRSVNWRLANIEREQEIQRNWRLANVDHVRERDRAYYKVRADINMDAFRSRNANRRAKEKGAEGSYTQADINRIYADQKGKCAYCKARISETSRRVDHIIPLARGGSNFPKNLQLLCSPCNSRKWALDPIVFAQRLGKLI